MGASTRELDFIVPVGAMEAAKGETQPVTLLMRMANNMTYNTARTTQGNQQLCNWT